jgi:hypothetical protein
MFHAPHVVYAGQLSRSKRAEYATLPDIHFKDALADYVVAFGWDTQPPKPTCSRLRARGCAMRWSRTSPSIGQT